MTIQEDPKYIKLPFEHEVARFTGGPDSAKIVLKWIADRNGIAEYKSSIRSPSSTNDRPDLMEAIWITYGTAHMRDGGVPVRVGNYLVLQEDGTIEIVGEERFNRRYKMIVPEVEGWHNVAETMSGGVIRMKVGGNPEESDSQRQEDSLS